ncbi:MAG: type II secretion system major pseudopilin GspG [Fimbriimonadaceae bacterium]
MPYVDCSGCGHYFEVSAESCPQCGRKLASTSTTWVEIPPRKPRKPRSILRLLWRIFTITFGVFLLLVVLAFPRVIGRTTDAKRAKAAADIKEIKTALNNFRLDCDRYPETEEGIPALLTAPAGAEGWRGPYMKSVNPDPWQYEYIYELVKDEEVSLMSYGKDGAPGGDGDDADIGNESVEQ